MNNTPHQKVWKVGSRWSHDGNPESCILDLFRTHHIVFVGHGYDAFAAIKKGDLVTVSSGLQVVALGTAMEDAQPFTNLGIQFSPAEQQQVHPDDIYLGCRIDFQDLAPEDFVSYRMGTIHGVNQRAEQFRQLAEDLDEIRQLASNLKESQESGEFAIKARSCTLMDSGTAGHECLLSPQKHYRIPVYQRPYSWGEQEVKRLLGDLFAAFEGRLGRVPQEPIFIGTLQITAGQPIDETLESVRHEVIDGQQRLTTLSLLIRALQIHVPDLQVSLEWLKTEVGGAIQQASFLQALTTGSPAEHPDESNRYLTNLNLILDALHDEFSNENGLIEKETVVSFYHYLITRVWFVVIETRAGLSKTLQIFDSINTSGMDLNGTDIFKIRYFEYLREKENPNKLEDKILFESVAELYTEIDLYNANPPKEKISMGAVLNSAKWLIATRLNLSAKAKEFAGTTFFERFFDSVLNVQRWNDFDQEKCQQIPSSTLREGTKGLTVELFTEIREARCRWEETWPDLPTEALAMSYLMWWSRYSNYCNPLVTLYIWKLKPSDEELAEFITETGKLMVILSVIYQKLTTGRRRVAHELFEQICHQDSTVESIQKHIQSLRQQCRNDLKNSLLNDQIAHIPRSKTLLCRVIALLDELEEGKLDAKAVCDLIFNSAKMEIDIEHIESVNHEDALQRPGIWEQWGPDLHGLGNLTVLERKLNLEIKNKNYQTVKLRAYRASQFATVRKIAVDDSPWSLDKARARKDSLTKTLTSYLCDSNPAH